jgi:hypothetical protein
MKASGSYSVMSDRAKAAPDVLDYFPTPPWAARAGGELIGALDPGRWTCWEPACGEGHMIEGLAEYFAAVIGSDVFDYGAAKVVRDFLAPGPDSQPTASADWIVTNPPFKSGEAFVRTAWPRARRGVAMLLRLAFLEGAARHQLLYRDCPLTVVAPFAERVPMVKGRWDPEASSATAYAWFIWLKPGVTGADERCRVVPIAPGAKVRLSKTSDLAFAAQVAAPLLEGGLSSALVGGA